MSKRKKKRKKKKKKKERKKKRHSEKRHNTNRPGKRVHPWLGREKNKKDPGEDENSKKRTTNHRRPITVPRLLLSFPLLASAFHLAFQSLLIHPLSRVRGLEEKKRKGRRKSRRFVQTIPNLPERRQRTQHADPPSLTPRLKSAGKVRSKSRVNNKPPGPVSHPHTPLSLFLFFFLFPFSVGPLLSSSSPPLPLPYCWTPLASVCLFSSNLVS